MRSLFLVALVTMALGLTPAAGRADHDAGILFEFPELAEWGHVVWIGGVEYWRAEIHWMAADWEPYNSGYFYDDNRDGLVWVSNDPWGFITEHYGYWRHHDFYGFVWRPLEPIVWRPYVASIFRDEYGRMMAWCPFYYDVWAANYYVVGFGFDDYYWGAFWGGVHYSDFYRHHYPRFHGYWVGVTLYDYDVYHVTVPNHCYRRDRDYRERRQRDGDRRRDGESDYTVQRELPAKRVAAVSTRRSEDTAPRPTRNGGPELTRRRNPLVEQQRRERAEQRLERVGTGVSAPITSRPAQQRAAAAPTPVMPQERPDVEPSANAQQTWTRVGRAARQPAASTRAEPVQRALESRRQPLQVLRPRAAEARPAEQAEARRESARPAFRSEPSGPAARPAAQVEPRRSAAPERVRQAIEVKRKGKNGG